MSSAYLPTYKERGSGPPLVWLHGIGGNQDSFDAQLSHFSRSWRCVVWDMPGYGNSPAPEELSFEMMADSVATLLEHLGESQAVVLGHSMGGMVAQMVALRHPNRVRALVLAASPAAFGKPGSDFAEKFLAQRLAGPGEAFVHGRFGRHVHLTEHTAQLRRQGFTGFSV